MERGSEEEKGPRNANTTKENRIRERTGREGPARPGTGEAEGRRTARPGEGRDVGTPGEQRRGRESRKNEERGGEDTEARMRSPQDRTDERSSKGKHHVRKGGQAQHQGRETRRQRGHQKPATGRAQLGDAKPGHQERAEGHAPGKARPQKAEEEERGRQEPIGTQEEQVKGEHH